jgi:hypothetical protein
MPPPSTPPAPTTNRHLPKVAAAKGDSCQRRQLAAANTCQSRQVFVFLDTAGHYHDQRVSNDSLVGFLRHLRQRPSLSSSSPPAITACHYLVVTAGQYHDQRVRNHSLVVSLRLCRHRRPIPRPTSQKSLVGRFSSSLSTPPANSTTNESEMTRWSFLFDFFVTAGQYLDQRVRNDSLVVCLRLLHHRRPIPRPTSQK